MCNDLHQEVKFVHCVIVFLSSFVYPKGDIFMSRSAGVTITTGDTQPVHWVHAADCYSAVRVAYLLLIVCVCYFGYFMFVVVCAAIFIV